MIIKLSVIIILCFASWLILVSIFALIKPRRAIELIGKFASTGLINISELSLRALVGLAFLLSAPVSPASKWFTLIGWGLFISAIIIVLLPRKWHASYALYWSKRLPPLAAYLCAPFSLTVGAYLFYAFVPWVLS